MRIMLSFLLLLTVTSLSAQHLAHGTVYGRKPSRIGLIQADKLETFMGKRIRISVTVAGRVTLVTKVKGGWFDVDAGHGKIITAHFSREGINVPLTLKNHYIVMEGIAQKQIIADDEQHYAGGGSKHDRISPKQLIMFEVKGLAVDK